MNQDFAVLVTPANARRLLHFSELTSAIQVPAQLREIAARDCINEGDFDPFICPYTAEHARATQFLLDCDMRGIVQAAFHPVLDELTILNAVRLAQPCKLTIVGTRRHAWRTAAAAYALPDISYVAPYELHGAVNDAGRPGILIADLCGQVLPRPIDHYARDFPRIIFYESIETPVKQLHHWTALAALLFPTMPHPWAIRAIQNNPKHWATLRLIDFATFYNCCLFPEYITSQHLLDSIENCAGYGPQF